MILSEEKSFGIFEGINEEKYEIIVLNGMVRFCKEFFHVAHYVHSNSSLLDWKIV